jgi:hypothetical protein
MPAPLNRQQMLDLYFLDARCKLIEIAAFLDRIHRAPGEADFRWSAFVTALGQLESKEPDRAEGVLRAFSDLSVEPVARAPGKGAIGAWPGSA